MSASSVAAGSGAATADFVVGIVGWECEEPHFAAVVPDRVRIEWLELPVSSADAGGIRNAGRRSRCSGIGRYPPFRDYTGVGHVDRLDRLPWLSRIFGRLFPGLRLLGLIRWGALPRPAGFRPRRGVAEFKGSIRVINAFLERSGASLVLAPSTMPLALASGALYACLTRRIPFVFLPPGPLREGLPATLDRVEPSARRVRRRRLERNAESISELYGTRTLVARYCEVPPQSLRIPGFWMHGWIPEFHNVHPAFVALHKTLTRNVALVRREEIWNKTDFQLVTRVDQEVFLARHGYTNVRAIGHPVAYAAMPDTVRIPGSLLVMPPHGHAGRGGNDPLVRAYVDCIAGLCRRFSEVRVCVTADDFSKGMWWRTFEKAGIPCLVGADPADPLSFDRMLHLFARFEYVTTNGFGSHIAYAAAVGAKVSVYGPFAAPPVELMRTAHAVRRQPELLDQQIELCSERALRCHYPFLFTEPDAAVKRTGWARSELGFDRRLSATELTALFLSRPAP